MAGLRFGALVVLGQHPKKYRGQFRWVCMCDCGQVCSAPGHCLRSGNTKSCGCGKRMSGESNPFFKHGHSRTNSKTYHAWTGMRDRCHNQNTEKYYLYGARGISISESWKEFSQFLLDMGECPEGMSIDRIDVNGNYEPTNCRWATPTEQANNRQSNKTVEYRGEQVSIRYLASLSGMDYSAVAQRIQHGWTAERAITQPIDKRKGQRKCRS